MLGSRGTRPNQLAHGVIGTSTHPFQTRVGNTVAQPPAGAKALMTIEHAADPAEESLKDVVQISEDEAVLRGNCCNTGPSNCRRSCP